MKAILLAGLVSGASLAASAVGQQTIDAWTTQVGASAVLDARVTGAPSQYFVLCASESGVPFSIQQSTILARGIFDAQGKEHLHVPFRTKLPANFGVTLSVVSRGPGGLSVVSQQLPLRGNGGTLCQEFDPNFTLGHTEPALGQQLGLEWDLVGTDISATNNVVGHPNVATIFDSANPTGGDTDLATPGYGPGNTVAYGQVIVLAENDVDTNADGFIDDPDDEELGGVIRFDYAEPYRMCSATLLDIDDNAPSELRFYIGTSMTLETIPVPFQGDNGLQTLTFDKRNLRAFEVVFGGSGAIARLEMVPCPMVVNLDETPFGKPIGIEAGSNITDQFLSIGLEISAMNNIAGHPDKAILFDSENPTGGDFDLMTPGPGINNTEALGQVLIVAENDMDANNDGLVDDPDDEEGGGQIDFTFTETVTFFSTRVLDVDALERDVFRFFDENDVMLEILEIGALGDNSVQTLLPAAPITGVKRIQINLTGSGAFARLRWCPDSNSAAPMP